MYNGGLSLSNLNPFAFKALKYLIIKGNLERLDENLFENFKEISFIAVRSDELVNFFHCGGTKWLNSINRNLNVSLSSKHSRAALKRSIHRLVSVEIGVISWFSFNRFYTFPDEDICLFREFPHSQLVLPLIVFFDADKFASSEISCTLTWLVQHYKLYFTNNFTKYNDYIRMEEGLRETFAAEILTQFQAEVVQQKLISCKFTQRFEKCDVKTVYKALPVNGLDSIKMTIKWCQYIIEVYMRTSLCVIGLITNLLTLKVIRNRKFAKNFSNSMYKHIGVNALLNVLYCLIFLFSLMNICIYPKSSLCSSVSRTEFAQYFYIYVILFLGNQLRICCNVSYIFISLSRFALSATSTKNRLRRLIEKQNTTRFYAVLFILALCFSSFLLFENKVNRLFQEYNGSDVMNLNINNAYDVKFCENNRSALIGDSMDFILTPSFYMHCEIFKWLNLVNNILNNGLFLIVSVCVDIFMVRYSNRVIEKKKSLQCPHLSEAISYKTKLNQMIITNGTLYFFSHFPEFMFTLVYHFAKSDSFINFCFILYDCTSLIEMSQTFHFISVGFQFFIFVLFDHNFRRSLKDLILI